ncbi:MAG TPA: isoamylase early set domain-containing protein [Aquihabitans sp.]|nr:isoamylase early set domain-containing protein [Aquihabitans sp.]
MPTKSYVRAGRCRVEFRLPPDSGASSGSVVGDFNDWQPGATPLERGEDGSLTAVVELDSGHSHRFRYLLDDGRWENDPAADAYIENDHGGSDSVLTLPVAKGEPADHGEVGDGAGPQTAAAARAREGGAPPVGDPPT